MTFEQAAVWVIGAFDVWIWTYSLLTLYRGLAQ